MLSLNPKCYTLSLEGFFVGLQSWEVLLQSLVYDCDEGYAASYQARQM